jgi:uncharacterized damage-inducible protein DinB
MMAVNELVDNAVLDTFFAHNIWANLKMLDFCANLNDEQLDASAIGGFGSIRVTLRHFIGSETHYVTRVNGKRPPRPIQRDQFPSFDQMREAARWASEELRQIAQSTRVESLVVEESETERVEYRLASLIVQAITHSTEHRAQINAVITTLGMEPPDVSLWMYLEEIGEFKETIK